MAGRLFVVATPLGNLEDLSPRAVRTLRESALIACEDTRRTARLLREHAILTPTTSFFEHNERWKGDRILELIEAGKDVSLVSDAGTPAISDPGYRLVREARDHALSVIPVPGPSAVVAALSVSGLPTDRFLFVGFLPRKPGARRAAIEELRSERATLVFFESPLRAVALLADLLEILGDRQAFLCREATKLHEEYVRASLSELRRLLQQRAAQKGEFVLVVTGAPSAAAAASDDEIRQRFVRLREEGLSRREAVKQIARSLGMPARSVYAVLIGV
jgi:16S rRNA (cytidine1402-2'-O)-methyltransferase